jgi:hypothetical protein
MADLYGREVSHMDPGDSQVLWLTGLQAVICDCCVSQDHEHDGHKNCTFQARNVLLAQTWKKMTEEDKQPYENEQARLRALVAEEVTKKLKAQGITVKPAPSAAGGPIPSFEKLTSPVQMTLESSQSIQIVSLGELMLPAGQECEVFQKSDMVVLPAERSDLIKFTLSLLGRRAPTANLPVVVIAGTAKAVQLVHAMMTLSREHPEYVTSANSEAGLVFEARLFETYHIYMEFLSAVWQATPILVLRPKVFAEDRHRSNIHKVPDSTKIECLTQCLLTTAKGDSVGYVSRGEISDIGVSVCYSMMGAICDGEFQYTMPT